MGRTVQGEYRDSTDVRSFGCFFIVCIFVVLFFVGAIIHQKERQVKMKIWTVELISPAGKVEQTWEVKSISRPRTYAHWSEHTTLFGQHDSIMAPAGWLLRSKLAVKKTAEGVNK